MLTQKGREWKLLSWRQVGTSSFIEGSFNKICLKFDNIVRHIVRFKCIEGEERVSGVIEGGGGTIKRLRCWTSWEINKWYSTIATVFLSLPPPPPSPPLALTCKSVNYQNCPPLNLEMRGSELVYVVIINERCWIPVVSSKEIKSCSNLGWALR